MIKPFFYTDAIKIIHPETQYIEGARKGNTIAKDINNNVIELDDSAIDAEVIRLQAEYDAQEYARNREAEYPSIADLVVALYDTDDKSAVEAKRASVKLKYPKPS